MNKKKTPLHRNKRVVVSCIVALLAILGGVLVWMYFNGSFANNAPSPVAQSSIKSKSDLDHAQELLKSVNLQNDDTNTDLDTLSNSSK